MDNIIFTISLNDSDTDIDDYNIPTDLKNNLIAASATLIDNPFYIVTAFGEIKAYFDNVLPLSLMIPLFFGNSTEYKSITEESPKKNITQLDMDGNTIITSSEAKFSTTKSEAKSILGSVEKIVSGDILIADSINKRAIIIDLESGRIKWEYVSDRYIFDAHLFPRDESNIINTANAVSYLSGDSFLITEGDSFDSPFTSRVKKIDFWGNTIYEFGEKYLSNPRDARPLLDGKIIIST